MIYIWLPNNINYGAKTFCIYLRNSLNCAGIECELVLGLNLRKIMSLIFSSRIKIICVHPSLKLMPFFLFALNRVIITHHNACLKPLSFKLKVRQFLVFKLADYFKNIAVSKYVQASLPINSSVILNRVTLKSERDLKPFSKRQYDFGFFASLRESKGVHVLEHLIAHNPDKKFVVCGDGNSRMREFLQASANVDWKRFISTDEVLQAMADTKVALCPSSGEPFGLTPLECWLMGCRVIYHHEAGLIESMKGLNECGVSSLNLDTWLDLSRQSGEWDMREEGCISKYWQFDPFSFATEYVQSFE